MFSESAIPAETIRAYLTTQYHVHAEAPFTLKIAQRCVELARTYEALGINSSAFITAWNPFSQRVADSENHRAQSALLKDVTMRGLRYVPGEGIDADRVWPGEPSILIYGLSREAAKAIGVKSKQNGLVWIDADSVPQLILLR